MKRTVIKIENLSKQYRLGLISSTTLIDDCKRMWSKLKGREVPFLIQEKNHINSTNRQNQYILALRNINLEVKEGDRVGIIGKNGAGKSTLLKILSQVTGPTKGTIKIKGKVGSLLEVGTGFHPELTGRENIYMNGTILGMSSREVSRKLDEIVDFAGVERYLDTPVKRYSSGMTVRLGFAVAAYLEPDILIVDEVLAVGDADFQEKAIGKMKDVSEGHGRTVLFVSHNLNAVKNLCSKSMLIQEGTTRGISNTDDVIDDYLLLYNRNEKTVHTDKIEEKLFALNEAYLIYKGKNVSNGEKVLVTFNLNSFVNMKFSVIMNVFRKGVLAFAATSFYKKPAISGYGCFELTFEIPKYILNPGIHSIDFSIVDETGNMTQHLYAKDLLIFTVHDDNFRRGHKYNKSWKGGVSPILNINYKKVIT